MSAVPVTAATVFSRVRRPKSTPVNCPLSSPDQPSGVLKVETRPEKRQLDPSEFASLRQAANRRQGTGVGPVSISKPFAGGDTWRLRTIRIRTGCAELTPGSRNANWAWIAVGHQADATSFNGLQDLRPGVARAASTGRR